MGSAEPFGRAIPERTHKGLLRTLLDGERRTISISAFATEIAPLILDVPDWRGVSVVGGRFVDGDRGSAAELRHSSVGPERGPVGQGALDGGAACRRWLRRPAPGLLMRGVELGCSPAGAGLVGSRATMVAVRTTQRMKDLHDLARSFAGARGRPRRPVERDSSAACARPRARGGRREGRTARARFG